MGNELDKPLTLPRPGALDKHPSVQEFVSSWHSYLHPPSIMSEPRDLTDNQSDIDPFPCQWDDCHRSYQDADTLYNHLCADHVGRKATNNLCLTCHWRDCGTTCAKRDHITSHLRGKRNLSLQTPPPLVLPLPIYL